MASNCQYHWASAWTQSGGGLTMKPTHQFLIYSTPSWSQENELASVVERILSSDTLLCRTACSPVQGFRVGQYLTSKKIPIVFGVLNVSGSMTLLCVLNVHNDESLVCRGELIRNMPPGRVEICTSMMPRSWIQFGYLYGINHEDLSVPLLGSELQANLI